MKIAVTKIMISFVGDIFPHGEKTTKIFEGLLIVELPQEFAFENNQNSIVSAKIVKEIKNILLRKYISDKAYWIDNLCDLMADLDFGLFNKQKLIQCKTLCPSAFDREICVTIEITE